MQLYRLMNLSAYGTVMMQRLDYHTVTHVANNWPPEPIEDLALYTCFYVSTHHNVCVHPRPYVRTQACAKMI